MMNTKKYVGEKPYIFISYSHKDEETVLKVVEKLFNAGYRVWYDNQINPGTEWAENISSHINDCEYFFSFVSDNYLNSENCKDELYYAREKNKTRILIFLENIELLDDIHMRHGRSQAILFYRIKSYDDFLSKLNQIVGIELCRDSGIDVNCKSETINAYSIIGKIIDKRFEILCEIGYGSSSKVFLAEDVRLGKLVAVKVLNKVDNERSVFYDIYQNNNEVSILKKCRHVGIPYVIDYYDNYDGNKMIIMDYIKGISMKELVSAKKGCSERQVVSYFIMLADILDYLHNFRNIIHRDIKPSNIIIEQNDNIVLMDFGIAFELDEEVKKYGIERVHDCMGTRFYAPPEQFTGKNINETSDIYSLGQTIYAIVTGYESYNKEYPVRKLNPNISYELEYIINKCIKLEQSERYQSVKELKNDLINIDKLKINRFFECSLSYKKKNINADDFFSYKIKPPQDKKIIYNPLYETGPLTETSVLELNSPNDISE